MRKKQAKRLTKPVKAKPRAYTILLKVGVKQEGVTAGMLGEVLKQELERAGIEVYEVRSSSPGTSRR